MYKKQKYIASIIVFIIGLLIAFSVCYSADIFFQAKSEVMKILSNAFFLPGVLFTGIGSLIFVSNFGSFDIFGFGTKLFLIQFGPKHKRDEFRKNYPDFYTYYKEKRKEKAQYGFLIVPGILFILLAVIFTFLFYNYL